VVETETIGARIRYWRLRRRGMTQAVLAGLAGVSQPYISQVEAGRKSIERRATLVAIASALQVTVADLLGQPGDPTGPVKAGAADAVPAIWAALVEIEEGERRPPARTREQLSAAIDHSIELRNRADYARMAGLLPNLLFDAAHNPRTLAQVSYHTATCLRHLGYRHLAQTAARIAVSAAEESEAPEWIGAARFAYAQSLPIETAEIASRAAARSVADLQAAAAVPEVRQILGQLHLSASFTAAVAGRDDDSAAHLAEATREADSLGDPADGAGFNQCGFGPTNVALWRMSIAVERGEYGRVIELARKVRPDVLSAAIRHQSYWLDLGRALAHSGRRDGEALGALLRAERSAPVQFRLNPLARDTVVMLIRRAHRRSVPHGLRPLARQFDIDA